MALFNCCDYFITEKGQTELSTQILAVNNHIYPACEIDTVINLDLDQFNKLSIVLQVNIKLQTKPSSLLDCIATEHEVLKEIIAYYSDKKISDRSRAALTLKTSCQDISFTDTDNAHQPDSKPVPSYHSTLPESLDSLPLIDFHLE